MKQVQEKVLPEITDEWASEASEFSTVDELRQDIETRMSEMKKVQSAMSLRNGTLDALVALVDEEPPAVLVDVEVHRSAEELGRRLDSQGVRLERYLEATGRTLEELIAELRTQAVPTVKVDLALRAVADAVGIEPSESELEAFMERMAAGAGVRPGVLQGAGRARRAASRGTLGSKEEQGFRLAGRTCRGNRRGGQRGGPGTAGKCRSGH